LAIGLLLVIKPLNARDLELIGETNKWAAKYLRWFGRDK